MAGCEQQDKGIRVMAHTRHKANYYACAILGAATTLLSGCTIVIYDGSKSNTRHLIEQENKGIVKNATAGPNNRS